MGDITIPKLVVFSPYRIQKPRDVPMIIPTEAEYEKLKDMLRNYSYILIMPPKVCDNSTSFNRDSVNFYFGNSAEHLGQSLEFFLANGNGNPLNELKDFHGIAFNFSPLFEFFSHKEREVMKTYQCFKMNNDEKLGFALGLGKWKSPLGKKLGEEIYSVYNHN